MIEFSRLIMKTSFDAREGVILLIMRTMLQIFFILFLALARPAFSQAGESSSVLNGTKKLSEKLITTARQNFAVTTKNYCINFWSAPEKLTVLSKFATVSEQCKCTEDEMSYLATDDLAIRLIEMQIQAADASVNYLDEDAIKATVNEWQNKYQAANQACTGRFIRRRESSR